MTTDRERGSGSSVLSHPLLSLFVLWIICTGSSVLPNLSKCNENWENIAPVIIEAGLGSISAYISLIPFPRWFLVSTSASMIFLGTLVHKEVCCNNWSQILMGLENMTLIVLVSILHWKRSHPHGNLSDASMEISALPLCLAVSTAGLIPQKFGCSYTIPFFSGYLVTMCMCTFIAICNEVWYSVGSNQFRMVALDTIGLVLYFFFPLFLLISIAVDPQSLAEKMPVQTSHILLPLTVFFSMVIVPTIINSISPLSLHWYANIYTHGRPNTKKVIIVCPLSTLGTNLKTDKQVQELTELLKAKSFSINIILTKTSLKYSPKLLKDFPIPATFGTTLNEENINLFHTVFNKLPAWSVPSTLEGSRQASRKLKLLLWSCKTSHIPSIMEDVQRSNGGNIIFLKRNVIPTIIKLINEGLILDTVENVLDDNLPMDLS